MTERFFNPELGVGILGRNPKTVFDFIEVSAKERSALRKSAAALEAEFKEKHERNLDPCGDVFSAGAAMGYPKPVITGEHLPKSANLHPKRTRRKKDGSADLPEFSFGQYPAPHWRRVVSDRIKLIISDLEPEAFLFFPIRSV